MPEITNQTDESLAEAMRQIDMRHLPGFARDIAEQVGIEAAIRIVSAYGGTRLYIPLAIGDEHPLAVLLGREDVDKLRAAFGSGPQLDVPVAVIALRYARNLRIRKARDEGETIVSLCRRFKLCERAIRNIVAPLPDDRKRKHREAEGAKPIRQVVIQK